MKPKVVVVGSANTDLAIRVDAIPKPGETVLGGEFTITQGGKGANQAVAAARLGADVAFVARLGHDTFGHACADAYRAEGINVDYLCWDDNTPSGVALLMVGQHGENIIAVAPGANGQLTPADVLAAESIFISTDIVLVQLEIPFAAVQAAVDLASRYHARVILNPAPAKRLPAQILRSVDILTPNESELMVLAGTQPGQISDNAEIFARQLGAQALIVTLGDKGARVITESIDCVIPGYLVDAVDTVAAGDAFNGALAVALSREEDMISAVRFANAVGALSVTRAGAQPSLPTNDEVRLFMESVSRKS